MGPRGQRGTTERGSLIKRAREPAVEASGQQNVYGAGKTATVRILATPVWPERGHAGVDVVSQAHHVRQLIGLTGQHASVDDTLTGAENLILIGRLVGKTRRVARGSGQMFHPFQQD